MTSTMDSGILMLPFLAALLLPFWFSVRLLSLLAGKSKLAWISFVFLGPVQIVEILFVVAVIIRNDRVEMVPPENNIFALQLHATLLIAALLLGGVLWLVAARRNSELLKGRLAKWESTSFVFLLMAYVGFWVFVVAESGILA